MKKIILSTAILLALFSCKTETKQTSETTPEVATEEVAEEERTPEQEVAYQIAEASGLDQWDQVSEVQFTFNVDRGEEHYEKSWIWKPKTQNITQMTAQDTITYNRSSVDSTSTAADKGFINDSFWLLAPMHLVWDKESSNLTVQDTATAPISKKQLHKITLTYGDEGGYTPGDAYDFFYDDEFMVREWIFRRGNVSEFSMVTTWDDYEDYNGIKIASDHKTEDKNFRLYFTDIAVKTE
ncbi:hypothetical protein [Leeuwenhoekiella blandensis]|uniref:hypothetical protein n=1 Tax=Leeuwenhoekiella blandensis TaxID=360293 RepID=UPI002354ACE3|nr:hypothetical protein [Leeuwenhoekiella blandensis]|tara:strand:+ start:4259 stop:4975 length:717 start_codon:yes stop_codon:yes gene_type:complete